MAHTSSQSFNRLEVVAESRTAGIGSVAMKRLVRHAQVIAVSAKSVVATITALRQRVVVAAPAIAGVVRIRAHSPTVEIIDALPGRVL